MYVTYVLYTPEDGHAVGRDMCVFIVHINQSHCTVLCALCGIVYVDRRRVDIGVTKGWKMKEIQACSLPSVVDRQLCAFMQKRR
jgi:hypothetical protein